MANGFEGMSDLTSAVAELPEKLSKRILRAWTRRWANQAWISAVGKAPIGKTKNLVTNIVRRNSGKRTLNKLKSLSRSVVIGRRRAAHFHLVNLGTKPRYSAPSPVTGKRAYRGVMPKNPFMAAAASAILPQAEADLRNQLNKAAAKLLSKRGG